MESEKVLTNWSQAASDLSCGSLSDNFGRFHSYLRIALTDRCNLRCRYCLPFEGIKWQPRQSLLTASEFMRLSSLFVGQGVSKIRLTGGEPLLYPELKDLLSGLGSLKQSGLTSLGVTTNGMLLSSQLPLLVDSEIDAINLSMDTLREDRYREITQKDGYRNVRKALDQAVQSGSFRIKVNCVVMRGVNDDELIDFAGMAQDLGIEVRFIEFMPFGGNRWNENKMVSLAEMKSTIEDRFELNELDHDPKETAITYALANGQGTIGFISSMTTPFCGGCNRIRLTADGSIKACLFGNEEVSLRNMIRSGASDADLVEAIGQTVGRKHFSHGGEANLAKTDNRPMISIGG